MLPAPATILDARDYVDANARRIQDSTDSAFLVRLHPSGWNTISREKLQRLFQEGKGELTLGSVLSPQSLPSLYPDLALDSTLRYVNDYPLVPVVNRANSQQLEGVISRDSVFQKYGQKYGASSPRN